jgi:hypothetical protein
MRLINHINEGTLDVPFEDINKMIHRDCKEYLRLIKGKEPLMRGMFTHSKEPIGVKDVRKDRIPSGTDEKAFKVINNWFQKNGHNRRDRAVITSTNKQNIKMFGKPFFIFPADPMSYTWVEAIDFNISDYSTGWNRMAPEAFASIIRGYSTEEDMDHILKRPFGDYIHTDEGFDIAYKKGYEFWIRTEMYYYVRMKSYGWDKNKQMVVEL